MRLWGNAWGCFKVDLRAVKGLEDAAKGLCVELMRAGCRVEEVDAAMEERWMSLDVCLICA